MPGSDNNVPKPSPSIGLTKLERERLGARARRQRKAVGLSRQAVADHLGKKEFHLICWEKSLPLTRRDCEAEWERILNVPEGWLRNTSLAAHVAVPDIIQFEQVNTDTVTEEILAISAWLSRSHPTKRIFNVEELNPAERRKAEMFAARYGVLGEDAVTLQSIGESMNLTRERVRQITAVMLERSAGLKIFTPCIDRLEEEVKSFVPATVSDLNKRFRPLLGDYLSIADVDRFCRDVMGRGIVSLSNSPMDVHFSGETIAIAINDHDNEARRVVRSVALSMVRSCGAAQLAFVCGQASEMLKRGMTFDEVIKYCRVVDGFEWLIEIDGWFWFGNNSENRLISIAVKILTVANRKVDIEDINAGFVRTRRVHYKPEVNRPYMIEPPLAVSVEILKRVPGVQNVQHDDFKLADPVSLNIVLSPTELLIYDCLIRHGGVAAKHTLNKELLETGSIKLITLLVCIHNSPIFARIDRGLYALRGFSFSPDALLKAAFAVGGEGSSNKKLLEHLPDADGWVSTTLNVTKYIIDSKFFDIPAALACRLVPGPFEVVGFDTPSEFIITTSGARRLRQFVNKLIKMGIAAGDSVVLNFHPDLRQIRIDNKRPVSSPG